MMPPFQGGGTVSAVFASPGKVGLCSAGVKSRGIRHKFCSIATMADFLMEAGKIFLL